WSVRYASAAVAKTANGPRFDRRLFRDRGDIFEGEVRYSPGDHPGVIRLLGYMHRTDSGRYQDAIRLAGQTGGAPDIFAVRRAGTLKYGFGVNLEQEITKGVAVFSR